MSICSQVLRMHGQKRGRKAEKIACSRERRDEHLHQVALDREARGSRPRVDAQLIVDRGEVRGDGAQANDELFCDLGIGVPLRYQAQHFHLAGSQACRVDGDMPSWQNGETLDLIEWRWCC